MTLQFTAGLLTGMGLTLLAILSTMEYLNHKELEKSELIQDLLDERNYYKKFYEDWRILKHGQDTCRNK